MSERTAWHERISELTQPRLDAGEKLEDLAKDVGASERQLRRWRKGESKVTDFARMQRIEQQWGYSVETQLEDLGVIGSRRDWTEIRGVPSSGQLLRELRDLVDQAERNRPDIFDLVRAVLTPRDRMLHVPGRWRATVFDVPSGETYPHTMFRAAEFERGIRSDGTRHDVLRGDVWADAKARPDEVLSAKLHGLLVDPPRIVYDTFTNEPIDPDVAWERLELSHLLRHARGLATMTWYGETGTLYRRLFRHAERRETRHLVLVAAYNERRPDPADIREAKWVEDGRGLLLIAPTAALGNHIGNVVGEALAWRTATINEIVRQISGRAVRYEDSQRRDRFGHAYDYLSERGIAGRVVVLNLLDMALDERRRLSPKLARLLDHPTSATVLIRPAQVTLESWLRRQEDQVGVEIAPGTGELLQRPVSPANRPAVVEQAFDKIVHHLERRAGARWILLNQPAEPLPWWPAPDPQGLRPFVHASIGDAVVRNAAGVVHFVQHGRLPRGGRRSPAALDVAPRSLLERFRVDWARDRVAAFDPL